MPALPRPLLVIEDADHRYLTTLGVLNFMDGHLRGGEYVLVEDGICDSFGNEGRYDGGPNRAIAGFLDGRTDYEVDRHYCDFFGHNVTWNTNGYNGQQGYIGHFVLLIDADQKHVRLHDPGLPPAANKKVKITDFERAWAYPDSKAKSLTAVRLPTE
jgi:hypothetical protein